MKVGRLQVNYYPPIEVEEVGGDDRYWRRYKVSLRLRPPLLFMHGKNLEGMRFVYEWTLQIGGLDVRLFRNKDSITQQEYDDFDYNNKGL